jgi:hypothetical protein
MKLRRLGLLTSVLVLSLAAFVMPVTIEHEPTTGSELRRDE